MVWNSIFSGTELHGDMEQEHTQWIRLFPFNMNNSKVPSIGHSNFDCTKKNLN